MGGRRCLLALSPTRGRRLRGRKGWFHPLFYERWPQTELCEDGEETGKAVHVTQKNAGQVSEWGWLSCWGTVFRGEKSNCHRNILAKGIGAPGKHAQETRRPGESVSLSDVRAAHAKSLQSCPTLCKSMDCSPPGSSVHRDSPGKNTGVSGSGGNVSQPKDRTQVSCTSCIGRQVCYH